MATEIGPTVAAADWREDSLPWGMSTYPGIEEKWQRLNAKSSHREEFQIITHCMVPENIHTYPKDGRWKFWTRGGSQKRKFLKQSKKKNWKFRGWEGLHPAQKTILGGGMDIFRNHTFLAGHCCHQNRKSNKTSVGFCLSACYGWKVWQV